MYSFAVDKDILFIVKVKILMLIKQSYMSWLPIMLIIKSWTVGIFWASSQISFERMSFWC